MAVSRRRRVVSPQSVWQPDRQRRLHHHADVPAGPPDLQRARTALGGARRFGMAPEVPRPVRSGDRVRLRITIKAKRESSRPRRGHFDLLYELLNQAGNVVLSVLVAGLIERRP